MHGAYGKHANLSMRMLIIIMRRLTFDILAFFTCVIYHGFYGLRKKNCALVFKLLMTDGGNANTKCA